MKKIIIGMAAGAMALGAMAGPASAAFNEDIWTEITSAAASDFVQLVEVAGYDDDFDVTDTGIGDVCSNGGAMYTVFAPTDGLWKGILEDLLDKTWAQILATPGLPAAIVNDHVINNSVSAVEMENPTLQQLVARSGFLISVTDDAGGIRSVGVNVSVAGRLISGYDNVCNGHVYYIPSPLVSTKKTTSEGLGPENSPKDGTPGGTNSLPDTL